MRTILGTFMIVMAIAAVLFAGLAFAASKSAVQEIEALIAMLILAVIVSAGYLGASKSGG